MHENDWEDVPREVGRLLDRTDSLLDKTDRLLGEVDAVKSSVAHQFRDVHAELLGIRQIRDELKLGMQLIMEVLIQVSPRLTSIVINFSQPCTKGDSMTAPGFVEGPITLVTAGQTAQARVDGYDQFGNAMPADFTLPSVSWSVDNASFANVTTNPDGSVVVTAVADGVANVTATLTTAEGLSLSDTEAVTVAIPVVPPPVPVLSSVKVAFSTTS